MTYLPSRMIFRVDTHVIVAHVARPDGSRFLAHVQVEKKTYLVSRQVAVRGVPVEGNAAAFRTDDMLSDTHLHLIGIERNARAPGSHEQAAPVRIVAEQRGLDQRRLADRFGDSMRALPGRSALHDDLHALGRPFAIAGDLLCQGDAETRQSLHEILERGARPRN